MFLTIPVNPRLNADGHKEKDSTGWRIVQLTRRGIFGVSIIRGRVMKRSIIVAVVLTLVIGGGAAWYFRNDLFKSKCIKLYEQYKIYVSSVDDYRYMSNSLHRWEVNSNLNKMQTDLAFACIHDDPEISISMFEVLIKTARTKELAAAYREGLTLAKKASVERK